MLQVKNLAQPLSMISRAFVKFISLRKKPNLPDFTSLSTFTSAGNKVNSASQACGTYMINKLSINHNITTNTN
ncbi:MAG: hypothetical protein CL492_06680 [Acinetobacter sp.]|nr:hypothetical protein [Acinetobacter sp.]MBT50742.1 hypothetical protein [Acinetobacter sp.]